MRSLDFQIGERLTFFNKFLGSRTLCFVEGIEADYVYLLYEDGARAELPAEMVAAYFESGWIEE